MDRDQMRSPAMSASHYDDDVLSIHFTSLQVEREVRRCSVSLWCVLYNGQDVSPFVTLLSRLLNNLST